MTDKIIKAFEAADSPKAKIAFLCFLFFAAGYFMACIVRAIA